jgi:hypothetical protein
VAFYQQVASPPGIAFIDHGGLVLASYPHADLGRITMSSP